MAETWVHFCSEQLQGCALVWHTYFVWCTLFCSTLTVVHSSPLQSSSSMTPLHAMVIKMHLTPDIAKSLFSVLLRYNSHQVVFKKKQKKTKYMYIISSTTVDALEHITLATSSPMGNLRVGFDQDSALHHPSSSKTAQERFSWQEAEKSHFFSSSFTSLVPC